jgi:hypothetical protein
MKKILLEEVVEELFILIGKNLERETIFLTPFPRALIDVELLLDGIAKIRKIPPLENGEEFNDIMDQLQEEEGKEDESI